MFSLKLALLYENTTGINCPLELLSAIPIPLKVKPKLENVVLKLTAEAMPMRILPLSVDNLEGNILIGWTCMKP